MKKILLLITVTILIVTNADARRWYVDSSTTNTVKDGNSWATATNNLQQVINTLSASGDVIWVRGFTQAEINADPYLKMYYPAQFDSVYYDLDQYYAGSSFFDPNDPFKQQKFKTKSKQLKIYGGFRGNEVNLSDRKNWKEYRSVLKAAYGSTNPGGVIDLNGSDNTILDGFVIENNHPEHVTLWVGGRGTQILANLIIRGNSSKKEGVICGEGGTVVKFFNVEIAYNTFDSTSSLISNYLSTMEFYNVTIACNNLGKGDIPAFKGSTLRMYNSIIWQTGGYTGGSGSLTNCMTSDAFKANIPSGITQNNVITASNPDFVNLPIFPIPNGDFHLKASSPAVDAGDFYLYYQEYLPYTSNTDFCARDLDGLTRAEGNEIDLGCYEFGGQVFRAPQNRETEEMGSESTVLSKELVLYPTSVNRQGTVYLENIRDNAVVRVYSSSGVCIFAQAVAAGSASITAPDNTGMYIVVVSGLDGNALYKDKLLVTP